jgi:hypothetical protein
MKSSTQTQFNNWASARPCQQTRPGLTVVLVAVAHVDAGRHRQGKESFDEGVGGHLVPVQKKAGLFFQPIWREEGTTQHVSASPSLLGSWKMKLCSLLASTTIHQNPSERLILCQLISHPQLASHMKKRREERAVPRAFAASCSAASWVVSLTDVVIN